MAQLDYRKIGFTLTVAEAAEALEIEPHEVRHLLLNNDLTGVMVSAGPFSPITIALHPDEVRAFAALRSTRKQTVDSRNRSRALGLLHRYLETCEPVDDYDRAMLEGTPLLACSGAELAVHVRPEAVADFFARTDHAGGSITTSMIMEALERVGGARRKGVIAAADRGSRKQRWAMWWRIPSALLANAGEMDVARQMINGPAEPGETARLSRDGQMYLTGTPLGS